MPVYYLDEAAATHSLKRTCSDVDVECPPPKRPTVSLARYDQMRIENTRLKKEVEKYKQEWMRMLPCC